MVGTIMNNKLEAKVLSTVWQIALRTKGHILQHMPLLSHVCASHTSYCMTTPHCRTHAHMPITHHTVWQLHTAEHTHTCQSLIILYDNSTLQNTRTHANHTSYCMTTPHCRTHAHMPITYHTVWQLHTAEHTHTCMHIHTYIQNMPKIQIYYNTVHYNSFIWCWNLDDSCSRSETPGKFWNVVLEKDGEDQLDRSCKKWGSITYSQGAEEYPTWNK